jgi:hypothetical protein
MLDRLIPSQKTAILWASAMSIVLAISCVTYVRPVLAARELIMITSQHCPYCMAWERDVGRIYHKSPYADSLPLTRLEFGSALPEDIKISSDLRGTPTFLILENRIEIDRLVGYSDAEMFWWQISEYALTNK